MFLLPSHRPSSSLACFTQHACRTPRLHRLPHSLQIILRRLSSLICNNRHHYRRTQRPNCLTLSRHDSSLVCYTLHSRRTIRPHCLPYSILHRHSSSLACNTTLPCRTSRPHRLILTLRHFSSLACYLHQRFRLLFLKPRLHQLRFPIHCRRQWNHLHWPCKLLALHLQSLRHYLPKEATLAFSRRQLREEAPHFPLSGEESRSQRQPNRLTQLRSQSQNLSLTIPREYPTQHPNHPTQIHRQQSIPHPRTHQSFIHHPKTLLSHAMIGVMCQRS